MPNIMTTNASVQCIHSGVGSSAPSSFHWNVDGGWVLVEGDRGVLSCRNQVPCKGYTLQSMGLNSTELDGRKAILVTDFNLTDTRLPLLITDPNHLVDDSTPAPIPAGQEALPLAPSLLDSSLPIVQPAPPAAVFDRFTQLPATIPLVFNLTATFQLRWILTLISDPTGTSLDLTNGAPGAAVSPAGGAWSSPVQSVTLTLTLPFLDTLAPGAHRFYLVAANQRGRSGYNLATLTVS